VRPVEAICWADTQVHPIEVEDSAIGLVRYENGAIGQFEVSWSFRGGMDLRDEMAELGYTDMFTRMLDALDAGRQPEETFYDGYVVNAIMDACYRSVRSRR
jgi:predicted dehydrogenase